MKIKEGLILVFLAGSCILSAGGDVKVAIDAEKVLQEARTWNAEKAEQIEVYLKNTPDDPLQRSILAAYYFATVHKGAVLSESAGTGSKESALRLESGKSVFSAGRSSGGN